MVNSMSLSTSKMELFVMIVNSIAKIPILDVLGVSGYVIVVIYFWLQCRCTYFPVVTGNF